jgi:hypothetical protein
MSTTAEQAISEEIRRAVIADQFAEDYLLITENDFGMWQELTEKARNAEGVAELSDTLREEWTDLVEQVKDLISSNISPEACEIIGQVLGGQGSLPFDIIARHLIELVK